MYMKDEKIVEIDDYRLELENRIRNLLWTISGDYTLNMKVDVSLYLRSKAGPQGAHQGVPRRHQAGRSGKIL